MRENERTEKERKDKKIERKKENRKREVEREIKSKKKQNKKHTLILHISSPEIPLSFNTFFPKPYQKEIRAIEDLMKKIYSTLMLSQQINKK